MSQAWSQYVVGSPSYIWEHKLKRTKYALKTWAKTPFNTPITNRKERVIELSAIQLGMEDNEITKSQLAMESLPNLKPLNIFDKKRNSSG